MKPILNQLIQLQELYHAKREQESLSPGVSLEALEGSIEALLAALPQDVAKLFIKLQRHYPAAVVPELQGICTGCRISLPTSLAHEIRLGQQIYQCPNCARILYSRPFSIRQRRKEPKDGEQPRAGISRFSSQRLMIPDLKAENREEAITELASAMAEEGYVDDSRELIKAALRREAIVTTAVGHGLAFPHVREVEGAGLTFSLGLKKNGLPFDPDGKALTKIIFFFVIPSAVSAFFLQLLSGLIEVLRESKAREKLLACASSEETWEVLNLLTSEVIK